MRISRLGFCALTSLFYHPSVSGNVRVCHPRGCLRGCLLEGHSGGFRVEAAYSQRSRSFGPSPVSMIVLMAVCFIESQ